MLNIEAPIFGFSHCRDVVVEVSKAGGFGVFGAAHFTPEQLEVELSWIDEHIDGKPYGVDLLMPGNFEDMGDIDVTQFIPQQNKDWLEALLKSYGVPQFPKDAPEKQKLAERIRITRKQAEENLDVALEHPIKLFANALGIPPLSLVERVHAKGIKVASLVGRQDHAVKQVKAGIDIIVAQGTEAGGHTGDISTLVLTPQVVDIVAPVPVLAAGGIANGRQMAAALALGAQGVWCGSVWLGTAQSEVDPVTKQMMFAARSQDTVRSRSFSGKPVRALRSAWTEAWEQPDAPEVLPMPLQSILITEALHRIQRYGNKELATYPMGQVIGQLSDESDVRQVFYNMLDEFTEAVNAVSKMLNDQGS